MFLHRLRKQAAKIGPLQRWATHVTCEDRGWSVKHQIILEQEELLFILGQRA